MSSSGENSERENPNREDLNRLDVGLSASESARSTKKDSDKPVVEPSAKSPREATKAAVAGTAVAGTAKNGVAASPKPASSKPASSKPTGAPVENPAAKSPTQQTEEPRRKKSGFWNAAPSWLISTVIHVAAILGLAAWNIEPLKKEINLLLNIGEQAGNESDALEEFSMDNASAQVQSDNTEDSPSDVPTVEPSAVDAKVEVDMSSMVADAPAVSVSGLSESLAPASGIAAQSSAAMRAGLNSRSSETKRDLLKKFGGTTETERAVSMSLKWLAEHQNPETGAWTWSHSLVCGGKCDRPGNRTRSLNGATGMALMCFLGAGQTHMEGEYKETVFKGLSFLINSMKVQGGYGAWWVGAGGSGLDDMYAGTTRGVAARSS